MTRRPPRFLASVRSLDEALLAAELGTDIIDLKEPSQGALGAVAAAEQRRVVAALRALGPRRPPISATIGDLPFDPAAIAGAIRRTAANGVDVVKFGIYADGSDARRGLRELDRLLDAEPQPATLVALLLVDRLADAAEALTLARAALRVTGVGGVMLDTAGKGAAAPALPEVLAIGELARFVAAVQGEGGFAGLAGSLRVQHIAPLAATGADILGFRGALCQGARDASLARAAVVDVRDRLRAASLPSRLQALLA